MKYFLLILLLFFIYFQFISSYQISSVINSINSNTNIIYNYGKIHTNNNNIIIKNRLNNFLLFDRHCDITGRRRNGRGFKISHSNQRSHSPQQINLHYKKYWWPEGNKMVRLRIATQTMRTIEKFGLHETAKRYGINLNQFSISHGGNPPHKPKNSTINEVSLVSNIIK